MLYVSLSVSVKSWKFLCSTFLFFFAFFISFSLFNAIFKNIVPSSNLTKKKWKFNSFITFDRQLLASEIHKNINNNKTKKNETENHFRHRIVCFFLLFLFLFHFMLNHVCHRNSFYLSKYLYIFIQLNTFFQFYVVLNNFKFNFKLNCMKSFLNTFLLHFTLSMHLCICSCNTKTWL